MVIHLDFQTPLSLEVEVSRVQFRRLETPAAAAAAATAGLLQSPATGLPLFMSAQVCETQMQRPLGAMLVISETVAFSLIGLEGKISVLIF